eukprot:6487389-Amphidinium_carterae.1
MAFDGGRSHVHATGYYDDSRNPGKATDVFASSNVLYAMRCHGGSCCLRCACNMSRLFVLFVMRLQHVTAIRAVRDALATCHVADFETRLQHDTTTSRGERVGVVGKA